VVVDLPLDGEISAAVGERVGGELIGPRAPGEHGRELERRLAVVGGEGVDVHERDDGVVAGGGLGDHHAGIGVCDEHDGSCDRAKDVADVGGVAGHGPQGVGDGHDVAEASVARADERGVVVVEPLDDRVPAG
jgi:hypothetical protein